MLCDQFSKKKTKQHHQCYAIPNPLFCAGSSIHGSDLILELLESHQTIRDFVAVHFKALIS